MFGDFYSGVGTIRTTLVPNTLTFTGAGSLTLQNAFAGSEGASYLPTYNGNAVFNPNSSSSNIVLGLNGFGSTNLKTSALGLSDNINQAVNFNGVSPSNFAVNPSTTNIFSQVVDRLNTTTQGRQAVALGLNALKASGALGPDALPVELSGGGADVGHCRGLGHFGQRGPGCRDVAGGAGGAA